MLLAFLGFSLSPITKDADFIDIKDFYTLVLVNLTCLALRSPYKGEPLKMAKQHC